jgi:hypothetical protein
MGNSNRITCILIEGSLPHPIGCSEKCILEWANSILRIESHGYSMRNVGNICGVHPLKMELWSYGLKELKTDELRKVAKVLEINFKVYEKLD